MMERGYLTLTRVRGVPLRVHWTLPLGALLFSGGRVAPGLWLGLLLIVALHEAGHALLVHRAGLVYLGVDLSGFGGRCRWVGQPTAIQRAWIAWGGVLAQLVLLATTLASIALFGAPGSPFLADLTYALVTTNLILVALNLVPLKPLDGAEAWPLFRHLASERARRRKWKKKLTQPAPQTLREALAEADREARERDGRG
jgi:Zn-dependent protease